MMRWSRSNISVSISVSSSSSGVAGSTGVVVVVEPVVVSCVATVSSTKVVPHAPSVSTAARASAPAARPFMP